MHAAVLRSRRFHDDARLARSHRTVAAAAAPYDAMNLAARRRDAAPVRVAMVRREVDRARPRSSRRLSGAGTARIPRGHSVRAPETARSRRRSTTSRCASSIRARWSTRPRSRRSAMTRSSARRPA